MKVQPLCPVEDGRLSRDRQPSTTALLPESTMAESGGGTRNDCFKHCSKEGLLWAVHSGRADLAGPS